MEVEKSYEYQRGNKTVVVKRKWNLNSKVAEKKKALNDYFEKNKDEISQMKNYRAVFNDYNSKNPDYQVSYTTILKRLHNMKNEEEDKHEESGKEEEGKEEEV